MKRFSSFEREGLISKLKNTNYDLIVIGGGITGAGIALDASSRGLKTALIEKDDFASGTSSRSTKLIHGGLRYLKQFEIKLVREVGTERAIVHQLAPHLVTSEKMLLPIIEGGSFSKLSTSFGLKIYDILAKVKRVDRRKMLNKTEAIGFEPLLPKKILKGAGIYAEYRTNDARLTLEVIKTSGIYGTDAINYLKAQEFIYEDNQIIGIKVKNVLNDSEFDIHSKYVVNATGPWVDQVRDTNNPKYEKGLHLTKGVHIVIPHEKLPVKQSVYFDAKDSRMIFAIPRGGITYVGTTDTTYTGNINQVLVDKEDADYLIDSVNNMFPSVQLSTEDIISGWAGLRPLIQKKGKSSSELSRKDEIFQSSSGLVSIAGGKLTGYRKMAQRVVDLISKNYEEKYKLKLKDCYTREITLSGGYFTDSSKVKEYINEISKKLNTMNYDPEESGYLVQNYGKQTEIILDKYKDTREIDPEIRMMKAELWFATNYEMVFTPMDFLCRRTGLLYFKPSKMRRILDATLDEFERYFQWENPKKKKLKEDLLKELNRISNF